MSETQPSSSSSSTVQYNKQKGYSVYNYILKKGAYGFTIIIGGIVKKEKLLFVHCSFESCFLSFDGHCGHIRMWVWHRAWHNVSYSHFCPLYDADGNGHATGECLGARANVHITTTSVVLTATSLHCRENSSRDETTRTVIRTVSYGGNFFVTETTNTKNLPTKKSGHCSRRQ